MTIRIVLIDNHDSFVYNLVDALSDYECIVFRNTVPIEQVLQAQPDLICLSPGPGYPAQAGKMMELIDNCIGRIPILGICLGFQALVEHCGGRIEPCGPVHGTTDLMELSPTGEKSPLFHGLGLERIPGVRGDKVTVPVARYHSLGAVTVPTGMVSLATAPSDIGPVVMAAITEDQRAIGVQFHPESILTPQGPEIIDRMISLLCRSSS
ncbi:glutamine amidotransferase-related protein [Corynebacterium sp. ES2715-CONJ3]|uniref:glutamine amidotransferase-related protein n=1 Tax=Corynebacterium sp. ES2715-CONJ3 TaxID=2974028 RepID=UPI0021699D02|nr:gamma-glutamyl-gamma-aminobutyrate hydrolase family protein [Corynebacterium sp. ES2715-CONJ3]MCS4492261.1 gamma-glutamyl-gamma-aminobutyrate hydrolase family protein [Corynebacterium sp. ES2715-CONJ3]